MQRLFSTFADGWPGVGLLLLRLLVGGALIYCGIISVNAALHFEFAVPQILGAVAGVLLLGGLWTPVTGALVAIVEIWVAFSHVGDTRVALILAVLGASLAMIGPGAWSLDARIFGRKQINFDP